MKIKETITKVLPTRNVSRKVREYEADIRTSRKQRKDKMTRNKIQ